MMLHRDKRPGKDARGSDAARGTRWALSSVPAGGRFYLLAVELATVLATAALLVTERPAGGDLVRFAVLVGVSIGYAELGRRSERVRRYLGAGSTTPRPNPLSVWSFAALLVLPAGWAAAFVVVQHVHLGWQRRRDRSGATYRVVFSAAGVLAGQLAASAVLVPGPGGILRADPIASLSLLAAGITYTVVDLTVLVIGMWLATRPPTLRSLLPDVDAVTYEAALLVCGVGTAEIALRTPWLVPLVVVPVMYLHRAAMVKTLHRAARTDVKTGLLNATGWSEHALASLSRTGRSPDGGAAVLVLDIDGFKQINDTHGHLAGDAVLGKVAEALRQELRGHDGVGRFGGDEFIVVLEQVSPAAAEEIAGRLHTVLRAAGVDGAPLRTSLGLAHTARCGHDLTALVAAADTAMYGAKLAGRDRLRVAPGLIESPPVAR